MNSNFKLSQPVQCLNLDYEVEGNLQAGTLICALAQVPTTVTACLLLWLDCNEGACHC